VLDALTKEKVTGANIAGLISGTQKFNSATDANGVAAYSWNISPVSGGNTYNVTLDVSREGYAALSKAVAFKTGNPINLLGPAEGEGKKLQMQTPSAKLSEKGKCSVNTINLQSSCNENFKQSSRNEVVGLVGGPSTQIFG
jgi:hypothetical protein